MVQGVVYCNAGAGRRVGGGVMHGWGCRGVMHGWGTSRGAGNTPTTRQTPFLSFSAKESCMVEEEGVVGRWVGAWRGIYCVEGI